MEYIPSLGTVSTDLTLLAGKMDHLSETLSFVTMSMPTIQSVALTSP